MEIWWVAAVLNFIAGFIIIGESTLTCLKGDNLPIARDCNTVQQCGSHEFCSLEQFITPNGFIRHKASCKDSQVCGGSTVPGTYMVVCSECCDTDLCSASGCNGKGYNTTRGHICYHCDYPVDDPKQCDQIRICSYDQVCGMHETPYGQYTMGCESKTTCNTIKNLGVCSACCTTDLCNRQCTVQSGTGTTKPPAAVTKATCQDSKDCKTIAAAVTSQGSDVCQKQNLKHFCNSTCGLCPGQTTRGSLTTTSSSVTSPATTATNYCRPNPCIHGTCISTATNYVCSCNPGYTGVVCDKIDACRSSPCVHGTCVSIPGSFHCTCHNNFTGRLCDSAIVVNPCTPNPCVHGSCTAAGSSYSCKCNSGYLGNTCNIRDPCSSLPCIHGNCSATSSGGFHCHCTPGYTGISCDTDINECQSNPCYNGVCVDEINGYRCNCNPGYTGPHCQTEIDECLSRPCSNHGICLDQVNGYSCRCFPGYTGKQCATDINECLSNPCLNGGTCNDGQNSFTCTCMPGYNGPTCSQKAKVRDCKDVLDYGLGSHDGIYNVELGSSKKDVVCDMKTTGGGWTVVLYREDNKVDFQHHDSNDYALGFGNKHSDFWQGNYGSLLLITKTRPGLEDMHSLTSDGRRYQLRVDLRAANGTTYHEIYDDFFIGPARDFTLHIGHHRGTAGDSLSGHNMYPFTTSDRDVDTNKGINCADYLQGSWWFHDCYDSCLTCPYIYATPGTEECASMSWNAVRYCEPLRMAKMMIRPM